jgi:hypothetical protein
MIANAIVGISASSNTQLFFRVLAVDFELRLYEDEVEVFGVRKSLLPVDHPLRRGSQYFIRYNNNDGGPGVLHFQVLETLNDSLVRYTYNVSLTSGSQVVNLKLSVREDPKLAPPS